VKAAGVEELFLSHLSRVGLPSDFLMRSLGSVLCGAHTVFALAPNLARTSNQKKTKHCSGESLASEECQTSPKAPQSASKSGGHSGERKVTVGQSLKSNR